MEDHSLLVDALRNPKTQEEGFRVLVKEFQQPLYWHIRKIVFNHEDADDVLQNTYVKIFKNIKKFRGESKLYSWMYRIATNESLSFIKERSKKMGYSINEYNDHMIDQLHADVYFDGDEMAPKTSKSYCQTPPTATIGF